jgi:hypothetical protein
MVTVRQAMELNICDYCACLVDGKCHSSVGTADKCGLIPEAILDKLAKEKTKVKEPAPEKVYDPEIRRVLQDGWHNCQDKDVPVQAFEAGFWTCYNWMHKEPGEYRCEQCQSVSYPDYGYCPCCGQTDKE